MSVCPLYLVFPYMLNQAGRRLLHVAKPFPGVYFYINTFLEQHI